ncbi:unnamed protein product, partial [Mesorhabditis spiculigera]
MVIQRSLGVPLQVEGVYTQDVIKSFLDKLTLPDVNSFTSLRLTVKPSDPEMGRLLEIYSHVFPKIWDESWTKEDTKGQQQTAVLTFKEDIVLEAKRVTEYWEQHRADFTDIYWVPGQKRMAAATKANGCSFLIHTADKCLPAHLIQQGLAQAYIALAKACNDGQLGADGIMDVSMTQYPNQPWTNRVKINTNQPASPELYEEIKKILREQNLVMSLKVKTSIASYISDWLTLKGYPYCPFQSPAETFSNSVTDLNNLLARTSLT